MGLRSTDAATGARLTLIHNSNASIELYGP
jgi:hypothetical protein